MISFKHFGKYGRFGNQLFEYAFLRTTAVRLGVTFYCPHWIGDRVFDLKDHHLRAEGCEGIEHIYKQPRWNCGFNAEDLLIKDKTDIAGYFQSERFWNKEDVRQWYVFRDDAIAEVRQKYDGISFPGCVGIHLRFGDMKKNLMYVLPSPRYYIKALSRVRPGGDVLVFSDDINMSRSYLKSVSRNLIFMSGNKEYEDLYLMTQCRDFVCSISTLSWWGAWLNNSPGKTVVAPREWIRPGSPVFTRDLLVPGWKTISITLWFWEDYRIKNFIKTWNKRWQKIFKRNLTENGRSLINYINNLLRCFPISKKKF